MKMNKYERLIYKSEKLVQKSLKCNSDRRRWKLQDKADYYKQKAMLLNVNQL